MITAIATVSFTAPLRKGTQEILVEGSFDPAGDISSPLIYSALFPVIRKYRGRS